MQIPALYTNLIGFPDANLTLNVINVKIMIKIMINVENDLTDYVDSISIRLAIFIRLHSSLF